ncbi:hypothetical protein B0H19DRAFT_1068821 [Mycena capillaripes]|nr:hypothetical protein B0H19DRAFT_1068821 [Mycena capillaripes]
MRYRWLWLIWWLDLAGSQQPNSDDDSDSNYNKNDNDAEGDGAEKDSNVIHPATRSATATVPLLWDPRRTDGLSSHTAQSPACRQKLNEVMPDSRRKKRSQTTTPFPEPDEPNIAAGMSYNEQPMDLDPSDDGPAPAAAPVEYQQQDLVVSVTLEELKDEDAPGATRW